MSRWDKSIRDRGSSVPKIRKTTLVREKKIPKIVVQVFLMNEITKSGCCILQSTPILISLIIQVFTSHYAFIAPNIVLDFLWNEDEDDILNGASTCSTTITVNTATFIAVAEFVD